MKNKKKTLELTDKQIDMLSESVLEKIRTNRNAIDTITNDKARHFLFKENDELNELLRLLTQATI